MSLSKPPSPVWRTASALARCERRGLPVERGAHSSGESEPTRRRKTSMRQSAMRQRRHVQGTCLGLALGFALTGSAGAWAQTTAGPETARPGIEVTELGGPFPLPVVATPHPGVPRSFGLDSLAEH